jgi:hypothetical protein
MKLFPYSLEIRPKTKCENERDARENGPLLVGAFTPQCEADGSYSSRQCHGSTGYCWCVDGEGNKLEETEVGPGQRLNCSAGEILHERVFSFLKKMSNAFGDTN